MRNHWYAPVSVFPSRIIKEKKQENSSENNNGSSIWDNFSCHFSHYNLDGSSKVLKSLCGVWRKLFTKSKWLYKQLQILSCNCLGDRCRLCYLWRMQEACQRALINCMVCFYSVIAISSYRWSFEVLTFLWVLFSTSTVLLLHCTSILAKN